MSHETICVVGVSGFIGSHVAAELLRQGYSVNGTLRSPDDKREWIERELGPLAEPGRELTLHAADLRDQDSLAAAMKGCTGVVMSAGAEAQTPETVSLMLSAAQNTLQAAHDVGIDRVVFTSSTGSTNPPEGEPDVKTEANAWSDADQQISVEKFSPAAKTLMERLAIALGERLSIRVSIMNPSLILGPAFQPEMPSSLNFIRAILAGERMTERAPNGSMSIIDVRDLAKLHVAALTSSDAAGRYFAVKNSWHWQDLLESFERAADDYVAPKWPGEERQTPTGYDLTRQSQLGVEVRELDAIIDGVVAELKRRA